MPLAHPLTHAYGLPVSPLVAAALAAALIAVVMMAAPAASGSPRGPAGAGTVSWAGSLPPLALATRAAAVFLLALAIAAGRLGADDELENLAPALVVGAAWPLLVLLSVLLGPLWRWIDPWDTIARPLSGGQGEEPRRHVWPAVPVALAWGWYLSAYDDPLGPRSVGTAVAVYTLFTVAACLTLGRVRWLSSGEPFGIVLSWMALLPRRRLSGWEPPRGAEVLLGVLAGGVAFAPVRRSAPLWGAFNTIEEASLVATLGVVALAAATAALLAGAALWARRSGAEGSVARAAVPAVAAIVVAVALDRNRLFTSLQLLPGLLGDPLGRGWDLFGRAGAGLDPDPLGTTGLLVAQLAVLVAGHVAGAVLVWRERRAARAPAALALCALASGSVLALVSH